MTSLKDIKEQIIKIKTDITDIDIAERQQEQIIKIKTDITDIDIAESKIQLISLQLNPREGEKEPTEPKKGRRNQPNSRERRNQLNSRRGRRNLLNPREREGTNRTQEREGEGTY